MPAGKARSTSAETPLLAQLVKAMNWVHHSMQAEVVGDGVGPFNMGQAIVLCNINLGITRPSDIAREMGLSRQAISQIIKQLEAKGAVEKRDDPDHKLAKIVCIKKTSGTKGIQAITQRAISTVDDRLATRIGNQKLLNLKVALEDDWGPIEED